MKNFWEKIEKPILALAPMAGFTDFAFREICAKFGADAVYSEMANVTALSHQPGKTLEMLGNKHREAFYVVQLFGSAPEEFRSAVKKVEKEIKPDGIDINFGCPVPKVMKVKAGAELMKDLELARRVIEETIKATKLPVSVKIRTRAGRVGALDFLEKIKDLEIKAVMIHGRTLSQGFQGEIDTKTIKDFKKKFSGAVLANGGINSPEKGREILKQTGADGLGIARGALGNPKIFSEIKNNQTIKINKEDISQTALKHARLAYREKGDRGIVEMRKHLCWYVQGLSGAKALRQELVQAKTLKDIKCILRPRV